MLAGAAWLGAGEFVVLAGASVELAVAIGGFGKTGDAAGAGDVAALVASVLEGAVGVDTFGAPSSATGRAALSAGDDAGGGGSTFAAAGPG